MGVRRQRPDVPKGLDVHGLSAVADVAADDVDDVGMLISHLREARARHRREPHGAGRAAAAARCFKCPGGDEHGDREHPCDAALHARNPSLYPRRGPEPTQQAPARQGDADKELALAEAASVLS